jgi:glycerol-3-phosphate dehydrogenase (NAD(P)+)
VKVAVIGGGAWGTALAIAACKNEQVLLWFRDFKQAQQAQLIRKNSPYLPSVSFSDTIEIDATPLEQLSARLQEFDLILVASPMAGLRAHLIQFAHLSAPIVWVCKGFEHAQHKTASGLLGHEICLQVAPKLMTGALSGPSFALEVAQQKPTALVIASTNEAVRVMVTKALHTPYLRIYGSDDIVGVEVGGAVKNVLAIATGLCDGLSLGANARAALITRGLAEMSRLGVALGARSETFMGLSGLGDLVLTATGDLSRNRTVGIELAKGLGITEITGALGHVAEGVYTAKTALLRATKLGIAMPIVDTVVAVIEGHLSATQAVKQLMARTPQNE